MPASVPCCWSELRARNSPQVTGRVGRLGRGTEEAMFHVIRPGDLPPNAHRTIAFRGEDYHAGISMFRGDDEPGQGARLHRHPYAETWIVRSGRAEIKAGGERFEAGAGDIVVGE